MADATCVANVPHSFVEIPQPGLYQLSDRAIQFLNERYPEKEKPEEVTMTES